MVAEKEIKIDPEIKIGRSQKRRHCSHKRPKFKIGGGRFETTQMEFVFDVEFPCAPFRMHDVVHPRRNRKIVRYWFGIGLRTKEKCQKPFRNVYALPEMDGLDSVPLLLFDFHKWRVPMKHTNLKSFFLILFAIPFLSFANESDTQKNYPVGVRKSTQEGELQDAQASYYTRIYPDVVYFPPAMHSLYAISAYGDTFNLEDGSVWKVSSYDSPVVLRWASQDPILITQNSRWFTKYKYKVVNQATGYSVEANLMLGPIKEGSRTLYINAIDLFRKELILSDQTRWRISSYDTNKFRDWKINDPVILGYNSGWDSDYKGLLINVAMDEYIRAEQY